jgi:two-component system, chemotaxis family, protein-glutamate methylesterase/glutaminase
MDKVKVLIVDDTVLYRKILKDTLQMFPAVEIVGTAPNGKIALSKIPHLKPDIMTLDLEMPELNGLDTLRELKKAGEHCPSALMVSAHTTKDASVTMEALNLGAFDFIAKPSGGDMHSNVETLKEQFEPILKAFLAKQGISIVKGREELDKTATQQEKGPAQTKSYAPISPLLKPEIVVIGISTGGPKALAEVVPNLDPKLRVPIVIVQHMPPVFTNALAGSLNQKTALTVVEATHGKKLEAGNIYIAPGGKQLRVEKDKLANNSIVVITDDPPENFCKPAVDYLFRSVSKNFGKKALGIIMTGMGRDGALGARLMKRVGAGIIAQDKDSSVVFGMPAEVIKTGAADYVAPLHEIAKEINRICRGY